MAWTAPATATVGQILTAAFWNAQVRSNILLTAPSLITADGEMVIGTAANTLKALDVMGALDVFLHEAGGLEADVSAFDGVPLIDGGATTNLKYSLDETDAPDANDDTTDGWKVGSLWVDVTNDKAYICLDITDTAAVWIEITQGVNHTVASHSDTTATGAELDTLTDGSDADALHTHDLFATGSYTGDGGVSQGITGIGFQPTWVWITQRVTTQAASEDKGILFTTDVIIDDSASFQSINFDNGSGLPEYHLGVINSLDADGFTVDDSATDAHPNKSSQVYNYIAVRSLV